MVSVGPIGKVEGMLPIPNAGKRSSSVSAWGSIAFTGEAKWFSDSDFAALPTPNDAATTC